MRAFTWQGCVENVSIILEVDLVTDSTLSHGALKLYSYLLSLAQDFEDFKDKDICEKLQISLTTLTKYKKELRERDLIYTRMLKFKKYRLYVGTLYMPASTLGKLDLGEFCHGKHPGDPNIYDAVTKEVVKVLES